MRPLARAPPCFSHSESVWNDPPLGRHRVFAYPRTPWVPARSGATVFFMFRVRLGHTPVRAPPCFSFTKEEWGARPLGRHRVFHAPSAPGARSRSGATVFFTHRRRLGHTPARAPPCFARSECHWRALPLGRHRVFHLPRASEAILKRLFGHQVAISFGLVFAIPGLLNGEAFRKLIAHGVCHLYASGVIPRSGATVFLTFIARLGCSPARAPPCFSHS